MKCHFGEIVDGVFQPSPMGKQATKFWMEIPNHFLMVELDEFIIMPNHIHAIIGVRTRHVVSPQAPQRKNQFGKPISGSISIIIGQFKSALTRWCRSNDYEQFGWQRRFHDHIIRNDESFERIKEYIENNPANWNPHVRL